MPARIRLLSTDFDGTLVNHFAEPPISAAFLKVLAELRANGARWAINTGRTVNQIVEGLDEFDFPVQPDFIVTSERDVYRPGPNGKWEDYGEWNARCAEIHDRLFAQAQPMLDQITRHLREKTKARFINDQTGIGIVSDGESEMDRIVAYIDGIRGALPDFHYQRNTQYLRFCHVNYSKGAALRELGRLLEIPREETFAAGDHFNDLLMLDGESAKWVACPVNSAEAVKETVRRAGGYVALGEAGDGVAEALRFFLSEK